MRGFSRLLAYINKFKEGEVMLVINRNNPIKLNYQEIKKAEVLIAQYPYFNYLEKERRKEIRELSDRVDENIGGGKTSTADNHAHENNVIKFSDDDVLNKIKHNRKVIQDALSLLEPYQRVIIDLSYFQRFNHPSAVRIAEIASVSRATVFRYRNHFVTHLYPLLIL